MVPPGRLWRNFEDERILNECASTVSHTRARNLVDRREIRRLCEACQIGITRSIHGEGVALVDGAAADKTRVDQRAADRVHFDNKCVRSVFLAASPQAAALDLVHAWKVPGLSEAGHISIAQAVHADTHPLVSARTAKQAGINYC